MVRSLTFLIKSAPAGVRTREVEGFEGATLAPFDRAWITLKAPQPGTFGPNNDVGKHVLVLKFGFTRVVPVGNQSAVYYTTGVESPNTYIMQRNKFVRSSAGYWGFKEILWDDITDGWRSFVSEQSLAVGEGGTY